MTKAERTAARNRMVEPLVCQIEREVGRRFRKRPDLPLCQEDVTQQAFLEIVTLARRRRKIVASHIAMIVLRVIDHAMRKRAGQGKSRRPREICFTDLLPEDGSPTDLL